MNDKMEQKKCISCKKNITNDKGNAVFKCPGCTDHEIVRCNNCRKNGTKYTCHKCEFVGPN
ncbi:RNA-binding protein [Candidatus Woesearchaeota archaeon]|nr:RNA-binding protein [Candidatus Woesearchaeota archaeon]